MNLKLTVLAAAMALACTPGLALAQSQRVPSAISATGKPVDSQPSSIIIAPAGGASGPGRVVAEDGPGIPVTVKGGGPTGYTLEAGHIATVDASTATSATNSATVATNTTTTNTNLGAQADAAAAADNSTASLIALLKRTNQNVTTLSGLANKPASATTTTDRSSTITTGGTAQQVMASNNSRRSFYIFNPDPTETMWCSITTASPVANGSGSFAIGPTSTGSPGFGMEVSPTPNAISCIAATTGHKFTAWESN